MSDADFPPAGPAVGIIMGSRNDWATMEPASHVLDALAIDHEAFVVSAHRTPQRMFRYAATAHQRGVRVIIAGAGGAAHLPGMIAGETNLPVIGVPVQSRALRGIDSLLSIVQMPGGIPVATMAIGAAGSKNAGLMAARILALSDTELGRRLSRWTKQQSDAVLESAVIRHAGKAT
ncbi:MAG: 5-(carboxyamino)imidazole ribonucleotide mutase [Planctomycetota bacterium]